MILTPFNSTNPHWWGRDLRFVLDGQVVDDNMFKVKLPKGAEFDFLKEFNLTDPEGARRYYAQS